MTDKEFLDYCKKVEEQEEWSLENALPFSSPLQYLIPEGFKGNIFTDRVGRYSPDYKSAWIYPDIILRNVMYEDAVEKYEQLKAKNTSKKIGERVK